MFETVKHFASVIAAVGIIYTAGMTVVRPAAEDFINEAVDSRIQKLEQKAVELQKRLEDSNRLAKESKDETQIVQRQLKFVIELLKKEQN
jgi:hypothetical protein